MQNQQRTRTPLPSPSQAPEKRNTTKSTNYIKSLSETLFTLCNKQKLTDFCIIASDGIRFNAHKVVLAAGSDLFMEMFVTPLKESKSNEVAFNDVNGETLKPILVFIYTGTIDLKMDTVESILKASNKFQIKPLMEECSNFMANKLDITNCLKNLLFAEKYDLKELCEKASKFAYKYFEQISNNEEFLKLNENQVLLIIRNTDSYGISQKIVFLKLIEWIKCDPQNREKSAFKLFSQIKHQLLRPDFIRRNRDKLPNEPQCLKMICNWYEWHLFSENTKSKLSPDASELNESELEFLQEEIEETKLIW